MERKDVRNPFRLLHQICERLIGEEEQRFVMPELRTEVLSGVEDTWWTFPREDISSFTEWMKGEREWKERELSIRELNHLLAECEVKGREIWHPRRDDLRERLKAIVESFEKLRFWQDDVSDWPHDTPPAEARKLFQERVDRFRTALVAIEPLIDRMERAGRAESMPETSGKADGNQTATTLVSTVEANKTWFSTDPPEESRYRFGPIEGTLKQLVRWLNAGTQPTLREHNGSSWWYIRKLTGRNFAAWCDGEKRYADANQRRLADRESETKSNEMKRNRTKRK